MLTSIKVPALVVIAAKKWRKNREGLSARLHGWLALCFLALSNVSWGQVAAKTSEPPTQVNPLRASPGLLNEWLRGESPAFNQWDLGGQFRARYDIKEGGGSLPANRDFRATGVENDNAYLLFRNRVHLGYTPWSWLTVYAEGRDSVSISDERKPSPEEDRLDLHQGYLRLGDTKVFPVSAKIGRQELIYEPRAIR